MERRKELLRERSPSPPPPTPPSRCPSPELPLPTLPPHQARLPESHAKVMYLSAIGLCRNSDEQKMNAEVSWSAVLDNRINQGRHNTPINLYFTRLRNMSDSFLSAVKRDYQGTFLPPCRSPLPSSRPSSLSSSHPSSLSSSHTSPLPPSLPPVSEPSSQESIPLDTALSLLNNDSSMVFGNPSDGSQLDSITLHDGEVSTMQAEMSTLQPGRDLPALHHGRETSSHHSGRDRSPLHPGRVPIFPKTEPMSETEIKQEVGETKPILPALFSVKQEVEEPAPKRSRTEAPPSWQGVDAVIESYRKYKQGENIIYQSF